MLYFLTQYKSIFFPVNVLSYITFRAGGAILTALLLTWIFGPAFIHYIKSRSVTQAIRKEGPKTHFEKEGTPTMGGVLILITTVATTLLWARWDNRFVWLCLLTVVYLGFIGFIDDYRKWRGWGGHAKGLSPSMKMLALLTLSIGLVTYLYIYPPNPEFTTRLGIPYSKNHFLDLGIWYILLAVMIIAGSSNAVNLTDGLDGLAIGALIVSASTYAVFAYLAGHVKFSSYLRIVPVPGAGELAVFLAAIVGAGLGFLWFNCYPAQIFMGDTGSLFLGGALGIVALIIKQELILVIVGGLFVAEVVSVILQVYSFRTRGKRIFKMAPLHHHFELSGWKETKVTVRFWIISIVLALIALTSLKLR